jgi:hypothetical protein
MYVGEGVLSFLKLVPNPFVNIGNKICSIHMCASFYIMQYIKGMKFNLEHFQFKKLKKQRFSRFYGPLGL